MAMSPLRRLRVQNDGWKSPVGINGSGFEGWLVESRLESVPRFDIQIWEFFGNPFPGRFDSLQSEPRLPPLTDDGIV